MVDVRTREASAGATCPLCREALSRAVEGPPCRGCETRYHASCLVELGGCSTLGCSLQGVAVDAARRLGCGVCGQLAAEPASRRRCACGATVHQACVDAHAAACARGHRLQPDGARPTPTSRAPARASKLVPLGVAVVLQVAAGALWGLALASRPELGELLGAALFVAFNVSKGHALAADLSWLEADDRPALLATVALLVPGLGMAVWWGSRRRERAGQ